MEGARRENGRGDSIWDRFADDGNVPGIDRLGCDSYHRWEEDLDLIADLGVGGYRFSISWPRVLPHGTGEVNRKGVEYYRKIAAGLLDRGVEPSVALYHWDLPQSLHEGGGWADRAIVGSFNRYTSVVVDVLGDLVTSWYTINEPWVIAMLGYLEGVFAPGITDWDQALAASHHLLLAHGTAVATIKELDSQARVGLALDCRPVSPASGSVADAAASKHFDGFRNRWFFDPVFGKGYPEDILAEYQRRGRFAGGVEHVVRPGDLELIATPIDFLGLNYYTTITVKAGDDEVDSPSARPGPNPLPGHTEMGWRIDPDGLEAFLNRIHADYSPTSIVISENGASYSDGPREDNRIHDDRRISYLHSHIEAMARARDAGAPVDGYYVWSLLDNLEWTSGYSQRFGLVWVDHDTGQRIRKDSFHWYSDVARGGPPVAT